jgi:putative DNA primase/helicase
MPRLYPPDNGLANRARAYAARGWAVFPIFEINPDGTCACGKPKADDHKEAGKHPRTSHGVKDATTNLDLIRARWAKHPSSNLGIATGRVSGIVVLDVDPRNGGDGGFRELEAQYGALPTTVTARTGGGGQHFYFAIPLEGPNIPNRVPLGGFPGLDWKADAGYVVAAPSNHESGSTYSWVEGRSPDEIELAPCPAYLLELANAGPGSQRVAYRARPWDGKTPASVTRWLERDQFVRARFLRNTTGLKDVTPSAVDFSLASLLAYRDVSPDEIEWGIRASRAKADLADRPNSYYESTVGKAVASACHEAKASPPGAREPDPNEFVTERGRLKVKKLASWIRRRSHVCPGGDQRLYHYVEGVYRTDGDRYVQGQVRKLLEHLWKRNHGEEVLAWLRTFPPQISDTPPDHLINLTNGLLDWRTGRIRRHDPNVRIQIQPCPRTPSTSCTRS